MAEVGVLSAGGRCGVIAVGMSILALCTHFCSSFMVLGCFFSSSLHSGAEAGGACPGGSSGDKPPSLLCPPGWGAWDGVRTSCTQAKGQIPGCKTALVGGNGEGTKPGRWINQGRSCGEFMAAGNQLHPPQCSTNPRASSPGHHSESFVLWE